MAPTTLLACPNCQNEVSASSSFCTQCGLVLRQPCPTCSAELDTPSGTFTTCARCSTSFWCCGDCARLYHLDRTSCLNSYCPEKGTFWTARFGHDRWDQRRSFKATSLLESKDSKPLPAWLAGSGAEREHRWPALHAFGLLISVRETGVVELWAERGAPVDEEGDGFREISVCLSRLDLGEKSQGAPICHQDHLVIVGSGSLSLLEMTSNPSLGSKIPVPTGSGTVCLVSLENSVLVVSEAGLWEVDLDQKRVVHHIPGNFALDLNPLADEFGQVLLRTAAPDPKTMLYKKDQTLVELDDSEFNHEPEWSLFARQFLLFHRNTLRYLDGETFRAVELPGTLVAQPIYCPVDDRLTLLLDDNTIRTCSPTGERFSFVGDLPGRPTTSPLKVGSHIYYGTDGRYFCRDEEAMLPRLNSAPWGELSYANSRLFGRTREGVLFAFSL